MNIAETIQTRRRELGLTQTQIAEKLGVTTPAVNRWEKGLCMPDITLLAPLARLLKIDMNRMFSFYEELTENEIDNIQNQIIDLILRRDDFESALDFIDKTIKQNPTDGKLIFETAQTLHGFSMLIAPNNNDIKNKIIELYEKSKEYDNGLSDDINATLIDLYNSIGEYDKAYECWNSINYGKYSKQELYISLMEGQEKYDECIAEIKSELLDQIVQNVFSLSELKTAYMKIGDTEHAKEADDFRHSYIEFFGLWSALDDICLSFDKEDKNGKAQAQFLEAAKQMLTSKNDKLSTCKLFEDVKFTDFTLEKGGIPSLLQEIMESMNKMPEN